jgi:hypothetical protein
MSTNEFPILSLDYLLSRMWQRRWLVLGCGVLGIVMVLVMEYTSPKYQVEVEVQPPAWEALGEFNRTSLVKFEREGLYRQFLRESISSSTGQFVWEQVMKKRDPGQANSRNLPVSAEVVGGFPKDENLVAPQRIMVTGASAEDAHAFLRESLKASRKMVLEDSQLRLAAAISLKLSKVAHEIEILQNGELEQLESQRREDRRASLQGGGFEEVPLAFLDLDELMAKRAYYTDYQFPTNLEIAAIVNIENIEAPRDWYRKTHLLAGMLVGLLIGGWLAVAWKPSAK